MPATVKTAVITAATMAGAVTQEAIAPGGTATFAGLGSNTIIKPPQSYVAILEGVHILTQIVRRLPHISILRCGSRRTPTCRLSSQREGMKVAPDKA
jgi:hypothetical protein